VLREVVAGELRLENGVIECLRDVGDGAAIHDGLLGNETAEFTRSRSRAFLSGFRAAHRLDDD
jgi:hypothetical protein